MKKLFAVIFSWLIAATLVSQPVVYINFVSHSEDAYVYLNAPGVYLQARHGIVEFAHSVRDSGAEWVFGSDYVTLLAIARYDTGSILSATNGKNLLKWLHDDMDMECDPHSHESAYNYSDIAKLHWDLGVEPAPVINGFIYNTMPNSGHCWMEYLDSVPGDSFPSFKWKPEILWGGGTPGHTNDPMYYGMWKPLDTANFFVHNDTSSLIDYSTGCRIVIEQMSVQEIADTIDRLLNAIQDGVVPPDGFYCTSMFFEEGSLRDTAFLSKLDSIIALVNVRVAEGKMEWKKITEVVDIWKTDYDSVPFWVECSFDSVYTYTRNNKPKESVKLYPVPCQDYLNIDNAGGFYEVSVYDLTGRKIKNVVLNRGNNILYMDDIPKGVYLLKFSNINECVIKKVIKNQ